MRWLAVLVAAGWPGRLAASLARAAPQTNRTTAPAGLSTPRTVTPRRSTTQPHGDPVPPTHPHEDPVFEDPLPVKFASSASRPAWGPFATWGAFAVRFLRE